MSEVLQSQEIVRLYEYEPCKPDLEDYVEHHGVKDMHWGVNNGPPYPLSSKLSTGSRLKKGAKGAGGSGGNPSKLKKKAAKAAVKAAKANKPNAKLDKEELKEKSRQKVEEVKRQRAINETVKEARKTGAYDREFLEKNLDTNPKTGELLKGKELDDAYRKYLDIRSKNDDWEKVLKKESGRDFNGDTKYGGFREIRTSEKITDLDERKKKEEKGYLKIKPETDMTVEEAIRAILEEFNKASREAGGPGNWGGKDNKSKQLGKLQNQLADAYAENAPRSEVERLLKEIKKVSGKDASKALEPEPKKSFSEKLHDKKVQKQRVQSLEKVRQTKAENTAKKKAEAEEKEKISKMREEAIKKADIVTMYKNATHFSNEEIQAALDRKGTLDRLASEVSKSVPKTTETPKKQSYIKSMVKEKTKEGLKSGAEAVVKNVATQALKMTLEQLALSASGTATNDQWDNKKKLEERRKNILRLIKT